MPTSSAESPRTQFFASALEALMEQVGVNQVQHAAATGVAVILQRAVQLRRALLALGRLPSG